MLGAGKLEGAGLGCTGEGLESCHLDTRKRKSNFEDTPTVYFEEVAQENLEKKTKVSIGEKYDREYPGWRDEQTQKTFMVPCSFVNKGAQNPKNGTKAEWTIYKTLKNCKDVGPIHKYFHGQGTNVEHGPAFVFHGQIYKGTEIDFVKVDMTGVTVFECKGITTPKQASGKYKKACSQLSKSIVKLELDDDIPVKRVVAFPLCKRTGVTPIAHNENTLTLFKEDCENAASFNKWLIGSCQDPAEKLTLNRYEEVVQQFLGVFHTPGNLSERKRRIISDPASCLESETDTFYKNKEQVDILQAGQHQNFWIEGSAGSGKTFLLKKRVNMLAKLYKSGKGKLILVVTYNVAIKKDIELHLIEVEEVKELVRFQTFRALLCDILKLWQNPSDNSSSDADLVQQILRNPGNLIDYFKKDGMYKYRHILIDEAQDLSGEWLRLFKNLLNHHLQASSIWVFSDSCQLVRREVNMPDEVQQDYFEKRTIKKVVRNTHEVFNAYQYVFDKNATKPVVEHNVYGKEPEYIVTQNEKMQEKVLEKLNELLSEKVLHLDIAVITHGNSNFGFSRSTPSIAIREFLESNEIQCTDAEEGTRMRHYKKKPRKVIVDTVQRFKGLEAKVLIFCIVGSWKPRDVDLYVAFSRAFCLLIVLGESDTITEIKRKQKKS